MMNLRSLITAGFACFVPLALAAQDSMAVDTTGRGYQIGYEIGSYLPVAIILVLALLVIRRTYLLSQKEK